MAASDTVSDVSLSLAISPKGSFYLAQRLQAEEMEILDKRTAGRIRRAFQKGEARGLLHLAGRELKSPLTPSLSFGRRMAREFLAALCSAGGLPLDLGPAGQKTLEALLESTPPMRGAEYLAREVLEQAWQKMEVVIRADLDAQGGDLHAYVHGLNTAWHGLGRVTFHLAEQSSETHPFAFLATLAEQMSEKGDIRHVPLGTAVEMRKGQREALLTLLRPLSTAAARNPFIKQLVDSGSLFCPQAWTPAEAWQFLQAVPDCEASGLSVRMAKAFGGKRPARAQVTATVGSGRPTRVGLDALLDFDVSLHVGKKGLSNKERQELLSGSVGLRLIRGQWVAVDPKALQAALRQFEGAASLAKERGLTFKEGIRLLAGMGKLHGDPATPAGQPTPKWAGITAGPWLNSTLQELLVPHGRKCNVPNTLFKGKLRAYQKDGVTWLQLLWQLGLGGCLADDMGLGKTIQVIALLLLLKKNGEPGPHLLVVPASLLGNWRAEFSRFAPSLKIATAHRSQIDHAKLAELGCKIKRPMDVVMTTYGTLSRLEWMLKTDWRLVVLDEAQAIKNAATRQARTVKRLKSHVRLALTGTDPTPVWWTRGLS